jgi:hypothetical protein
MSDPVTAAVAASGVAASATSAAASAGFWGALAGFVAGWAFLILGVILVLGMISEHTDSSGWSIFFLLIAGAVVFMSFSVSWTMLAIYAGAYLVVGLLWSFWRYKRHAEKVVAKNKTADARQKQQALESLHPKEMLGSITAWILVWPFSLVQNLLGDIINFIQALVTKFFRGVYHRIYDAAVAALQ